VGSSVLNLGSDTGGRRWQQHSPPHRGSSEAVLCAGKQKCSFVALRMEPLLMAQFGTPVCAVNPCGKGNSSENTSALLSPAIFFSICSVSFAGLGRWFSLVLAFQY